MLRASARGLVDLNSIDPSNLGWWRHLWSVCATLEADDARDIDRMNFDFFIAAMSRPNLKDEDRKTIVDAALSVINRCERRNRPWVPDAAEANAKAMQDLSKSWEKRFGKLDDPETQAKIAADVRKLKSRIRPVRRLRRG